MLCSFDAKSPFLWSRLLWVIRGKMINIDYMKKLSRFEISSEFHMQTPCSCLNCLSSAFQFWNFTWNTGKFLEIWMNSQIIKAWEDMNKATLRRHFRKFSIYWYFSIFSMSQHSELVFGKKLSYLHEIIQN